MLPVTIVQNVRRRRVDVTGERIRELIGDRDRQPIGDGQQVVVVLQRSIQRADLGCLHRRQRACRTCARCVFATTAAPRRRAAHRRLPCRRSCPRRLRTWRGSNGQDRPHHRHRRGPPLRSPTGTACVVPIVGRTRWRPLVRRPGRCRRPCRRCSPPLRRPRPEAANRLSVAVRIISPSVTPCHARSRSSAARSVPAGITSIRFGSISAMFAAASWRRSNTCGTATDSSGPSSPQATTTQPHAVSVNAVPSTARWTRITADPFR